jgi:hypothetical protein
MSVAVLLGGSLLDGCSDHSATAGCPEQSLAVTSSDQFPIPSDLGKPQALIQFRSGTTDTEVERVAQTLQDWHPTNPQGEFNLGVDYAKQFVYVQAGSCLSDADKAALRQEVTAAHSKSVEKTLGF